MKKLVLIFLSAILFNCGSSKDTTSTKLSKKTLKGTWEVTAIRFVGEQGLYKADMFDFADSPCFKGSTWVFIPNNGSGKFTTNASPSQCDGAGSRIHWSFFEPGDGSYLFQFKYVDDKNKPIDPSNSGYRSKIETLTETEMSMRVSVTHKGNPFDVVMTFSKTSDDITL
ncbi:MAG: lipocalin family protein [Flavobacteriaceae bacterium]|jgi:hypothetical protein|nr:lipocalin family protein [Flavobacteriaceae bacterium]